MTDEEIDVYATSYATDARDGAEVVEFVLDHEVRDMLRDAFAAGARFGLSAPPRKDRVESIERAGMTYAGTHHRDDDEHGKIAASAFAAGAVYADDAVRLAEATRDAAQAEASSQATAKQAMARRTRGAIAIAREKMLKERKRLLGRTMAVDDPLVLTARHAEVAFEDILNAIDVEEQVAATRRSGA